MPCPTYNTLHAKTGSLFFMKSLILKCPSCSGINIKKMVRRKIIKEQIEHNVSDLKLIANGVLMSPSLSHSYICTKILKQLIETDFEPLVELTLDIEGALTPDISVYKDIVIPDFLEDKVKYDIMPILAIEILSPSQNILELVNKAKRMIKAQIIWVWIVDTYARTVIVMGENSRDTVHRDIVESEGIKVNFKEIFP